MSADEVAQQVLTVIKELPTGATNNDVVLGLPEIPAGTRLEALNNLLKQGLIEVLQKGETLIYRIKDQKTGPGIKVTDAEERIVYKLIEESGNMGVWIREIRNTTNLNLTQLNKILKSLETKKLIKAVKSVSAARKKVYMLYNVEPDRSITGGAWYQDQDFESEFVDVLNQQCLRFLQMKRENAEKLREGPLVFRQMSNCTVQEVLKFIADLGISKVKLEEDDLETILKTIVYDGNAERTMVQDGSYVYRAIDCPLEPPGLVQLPCGICPFIKTCSKIGDISPLKCKYLADWLE